MEDQEGIVMAVSDEVKWTSDELICGDFTYSLRGVDKEMENQISAVYNADTQQAIRLMLLHALFYERLEDEEYVTRGSIIACTNGLNLKRLESLKDNGVHKDNGDAVMTCNHCQVDKNVYSFGICKNPAASMPKTEVISLYTMNKVDDSMGNVPSQVTGQRCIPIVVETEWQQGSCSTFIWDDEIKDYKSALKKSAYLTCQYSGIITVVETPESKKVKAENDLRDKIIEVADWYDTGCGQGLTIIYSMTDRGTKPKPDNTRDIFFQPWQPYEYLDCSGYIGAVYTSAGIKGFDANDPMNCLNTVKIRDTSLTFEITKNELLPGDLVFRNNKGAGGANHVGIFSHFDSNGHIVAYDCGTANGVTLRTIQAYWEDTSSVYFRYNGFEK